MSCPKHEETGSEFQEVPPADAELCSQPVLSDFTRKARALKTLTVYLRRYVVMVLDYLAIPLLGKIPGTQW